MRRNIVSVCVVMLSFIILLDCIEYNYAALLSHDCKCNIWYPWYQTKEQCLSSDVPKSGTFTMVWSWWNLVILFCHWPKCRKAQECIGVTGWRAINSGSGYLGSRTLTLHALCDAVCQGCHPSLFPSKQDTCGSSTWPHLPQDIWHIWKLFYYKWKFTHKWPCTFYMLTLLLGPHKNYFK